jgi:hypothetical protein
MSNLVDLEDYKARHMRQLVTVTVRADGAHALLEVHDNALELRPKSARALAHALLEQADMAERGMAE